jgi:hypothetical protein
MDRRLIANELEKIARELVAFEFPTKEELEKYLKEHPDANKSLHTVKPTENKPAKPEEKPVEKPSKPEEKSTEKTTKPEEKTTDKPAKPEEKPGEKPAEKPAEEHPKIKKLRENPPPDIDTPEEKKIYNERVSQYKVEIVGDNEESAKQVAAELARGIQDTADVCKVNPPICAGNLGITRSNMPQLHDKTLKAMKTDADKDDATAADLEKKVSASTDEKEKTQLTEKAAKKRDSAKDTRKKVQAAIDSGADPNDDKTTTDHLLDHLEKSGVKVKGRKGDVEKIPVGSLRATQREIQAKKTVEMADAYFGAKFKPNKVPIIVSTEEDSSHCILDGHHRWSSALMSDSNMEMNCIVVDKPIRDILKTALEMPGVYRADLKGNIVKKDTPLDLSGWKEGEERKVTEARCVGAELRRLEACRGM